MSVGGCGLVLDLDGPDASDAGDGRDGQLVRPDAGGADAAGDASPAEADAARTDAGSAGCVDLSDPDLLAHYGFEHTLDEGTGLGPSGTTSRGDPAFTAGPDGCGAALHFPPSELPSYGLVEDHEAWDQVRSVDLWVRIESLPSEGSALGILVRDEMGTAEPGHFALLIEEGGHLVLRVQPEGSMEINPGGYVCSPVVPLGEWIHVGVNAGDGLLELFVDGTRVNEAVELSSYFYGARCPQDPSFSSPPLTNSLDWVLGANSWDTSVRDHLVAGAIDELRFRKRRIDYEASP